MDILNVNELGANVNVTLKQADLHKFADDLLSIAIERVKVELSLHPQDVYYSVNQVSEMLSVDRTTLHRWNKIGYLTPLKFGGLVRYRKSDIEALIEKKDLDGSSK